MSLQVCVLWSEGCEACRRTLPVVHKIAYQYIMSVEFVYWKVTNSKIENFMLNKLGIPIDEDTTLSDEEREELREKGIPEVSSMPSFILRDTREPFIILEFIAGGIGKPPTHREKQAFEKLFYGMLDHYGANDALVEFKANLREQKPVYGEFTVRQKPFPDL